MTRADPDLQTLYMEKRECVHPLPEVLLSRRRIEAYRRMSGLAMVEMAGRDSVAAALEACRVHGFTDLLPTYVYTGTEVGPWSSVLRAVARLKERLPHVRVHELLVLGSPAFWRALNGRFVSELVTRFGFYTPCIGCHLYLHAVRIPLAVELGCIPVIGGERELHDGAVKVNQIGAALNAYTELTAEFGVELLLPLRKIDSGANILEILGFDWAQGEEQLGCVLSGNYKGLDGGISLGPNLIRAFLDGFILPSARRVLNRYLSGEVPDPIAEASGVLRGR